MKQNNNGVPRNLTYTPPLFQHVLVPNSCNNDGDDDDYGDDDDDDENGFVMIMMMMIVIMVKMLM